MLRNVSGRFLCNLRGRADGRRTFRDFVLTGDEEAKRVLIDAADSLVELYAPEVSLAAYTVHFVPSLS